MEPTEQDELRRALTDLVGQLHQRILGLPGHPWIPGGEFADGQLMAALRAAEDALQGRES